MGVAEVTLAARWPALAPVEATVACGGGPHRLRWAGGRLHALDHADDEGERLLVALGGDPPACLELLAAWEAHRDDLRVLTLGPRHDDDRSVIDGAAVEAVRTGQFANNLHSDRTSRAQLPPQVRARAMPQFENLDEQEDHLRRHLELLRLFTVPTSLQQRLCVTVAAAWLDRDPDCPALHAALVGRARPLLRLWAGGDVAVHFTIGPNAHVHRTAEGAVAAELPTSWLVEVWGPGLALVDGHFVLDVLDGGRLHAVAPDGAVVDYPAEEAP
ncbi:MAG: hypothetical protein ACRD2W_09985 [Acidimicrobiales bacterium]